MNDVILINDIIQVNIINLNNIIEEYLVLKII